ncbi:MAG: flagellar basal body P-ring formation chaperone FlgA [Acidithiobacillus sp.]
MHTISRCSKRAIPAVMMLAVGFWAGNLSASPAWELSTTVLAAARSALPVRPGEIYRPSAPSTKGWIRACAGRLSAKVTSLTRWSATVRVSCAGGWSLYVPFQREYVERVVLARHFLPAGAVITGKDVRLQSLKTDAQTGSICTRLSEVVGKRVNTGVPSRSLVRPNELSSPLLVRQGERVMLEARYGNIMVKVMGTAMEDGRAGSTLLVRNDASHKVLTGVVAANGAVLMTPGAVS